MPEQFLPRSLDNVHRGHPLALWILGLLGLMKIAMGVGAMVNGRNVARAADGIPLESFSPEAAQTVVSLFATWGLTQVLLGLLCALALVRYRAMAPLVFLLLLFENIGRKVVLYFVPYATAGSTPNFAVNASFVGLMLAGLALSLWRRRESAAQP